CKTRFTKLDLNQGWETDESRKLKKLSSILKDKLPCTLQLAMSGQYESRVCTKCCTTSSVCGNEFCPQSGEYGTASGYGAAGFKASCSPSAAIVHWPEVSGSVEIRVSINRSWDTCVPRDDGKMCIHLN